MNHVDEYLGARLRRRREELGLSLARQASLVGVSIERLSLIEVGIVRADAPTLFQCCRSLELDLADLFEELMDAFPPGYEPSSPHPDH